MKKTIAVLLLCSPLLLRTQNLRPPDSLIGAPMDKIERFIKAHPDADVGLVALKANFGEYNHSLEKEPVAQVKRMYASLSTRIKSSKDGKAYGEMLEKFNTLMVSAAVPDFTATDADGKTVKLSDLHGKYVLLDFWASWCIPCRKEFPYLKKAYAQFKDKNFEIVGYSIDNDKSLWISAIENDDTPWVQLSLLKGVDDPVALLYSVHSVPQNWLIDPTGKVIATNLRGEAVEKKLAELIK